MLITNKLLKMGTDKTNTSGPENPSWVKKEELEQTRMKSGKGCSVALQASQSQCARVGPKLGSRAS